MLVCFINDRRIRPRAAQISVSHVIPFYWKDVQVVFDFLQQVTNHSNRYGLRRAFLPQMLWSERGTLTNANAVLRVHGFVSLK